MKCQPLLSLLRPSTQENLAFLKASNCGFEGIYSKVCCDNENHITTVTPEPTTFQQQTEIPGPPDVTNHPNLKLLNNNICGPITEQKIYGGNKTGVFDFPWMALLAYNTGGTTPEFRCGGSLINKRYILTAAHCVTLLPPDLTLVGVRIGEHDLSTERDCDNDEDGLEIVCAEKYQDFDIESVHYHPDYSKAKMQNDIGLIRLKSDVDLRPENARPVCLPIGTAATLGYKKVTVTGWGATEITGNQGSSQVLLQVRLPLVSLDQCASIFKAKGLQITNKQICAGGVKQSDACSGDSGGSLQAPGVYNGQSKYIQYGVVSFGLSNCGTVGVPGVYTNVSYYVNWILDTMAE